jgi:hypothetical protein
MANVDSPFGLRPVRYLNGAPWNGQVNRYLLDSGNSTATFIGDLVTLAGSAGLQASVVTGIPTSGMPTIAQSVAGTGPHLGVVVGFEVLATNLELKHRLASTSRVALVVDDPNVIFEIQEVSGGTALTADEVGLNANVVVAAGSTVTGLSGMELNNGSEAGTVGLDLKILRLALREDNAIGEHAKWEVLINHHCFRAGVTGL